jgi:hypothetical protein
LAEGSYGKDGVGGYSCYGLLYRWVYAFDMTEFWAIYTDSSHSSFKGDCNWFLESRNQIFSLRLCSKRSPIEKPETRTWICKSCCLNLSRSVYLDALELLQHWNLCFKYISSSRTEFRIQKTLSSGTCSPRKR